MKVGAVILIILIIRAFMKKAPKKYLYILWAAAAVCAGAAFMLLTNGIGTSPGLSCSGHTQLRTGENAANSLSQAVDYCLDKRTRTVAFCRELWQDGELADYELLDVMSAGEDIPEKGRIVADGTCEFSGGTKWQTPQFITGTDDIKDCGKSAEKLQELWEKTSAIEEKGESEKLRLTEDGWLAASGEIYAYRYFTAGMLPNAEYGGIAEILADDPELTYEEAMEPPVSDTYVPGKKYPVILFMI